MEITGRLTADATVNTTKSEKEVVNFRIAVNDSYRDKTTGEIKELTTYINCAYWRTSKAAAWLRKGLLVQLYGRIGMNVYNNMKGEAVGSLTFHVKDIDVLAFPKRTGDGAAAQPYTGKQQSQNSEQAKDDLPF